MSVPVVGLWVRAPGCADLQEMRENVFVNRDNIKPIPEERKSLSKLRKLHPGIKAALVDGIDAFDDSYFGVGESEALFMDPQQRLLMQGVVHALEDAGISLEMVSTHQPAVFTAAWCYDYKDLLPADQYLASGNSASTMCGRISYFFNSRGASVGVETACSSSLVALHLARQSILVGESQMAIVCGANHIGYRSYNSLYQSHMVSPDGRSAAFDRSANGFVRAESFTVAIVCSPQFAEKYNLHVRCHVVGSAYNNDGRTASLIAPNPVAQHEVQMSAMKGIDSATVDVVTCHGTGTKLGDQVELTAINKSFKPSIRVIGPKSSLGHGEGSAGLIGVFQSILLMEQGLLPCQLHVSLPIELLEDKSLALVCEEIDANRVAVSSYGFGGTNSSAVLDRNQKSEKTMKKSGLNVLLLSAKSERVLKDHAQNYAEYLETTDKELADILHTTNNRRSFYDCRIAVIGKNRTDLIRNLRNGNFLCSSESGDLICEFGSENVDLADFRRLFNSLPELDATFTKHCNEISIPDLRQAIFFPFRSTFTPSTLAVAELLAVVSLFEVLHSYGVVPKTLSGQGKGAVLAAAVGGFVSVKDAANILEAIVEDKNVESVVKSVKIQSGKLNLVKGKSGSKKISNDDLLKMINKESKHGHAVKFIVADQDVTDDDYTRTIEKLVGSLFVNGHDVKPHMEGEIVEVPAYPFTKRIFWPSEEDRQEDEEETYEEPSVDSFDVSSVTTKVREVVTSFVTDLESDDSDLIEGGLDSLSMIEMIEAIGTAFEIQMPFDILESAPSIAAISEFVAEKLQSADRLPKSQSERKNSKEKSTRIGVISTDFRFSGAVTSFEELWDTMLTGKIVTGEMSEERKRQIGTDKEFQSGLLGEDVSRFDGGFFGVSKDEAMFMDPQHRLLLHCAYNAWEKAGMPQMANADLFLAVAAHSEYRALAEKHVSPLDDRLWTGTNHSMMAGRLAQLLGVRGRALVVDSTCSSVASALELCMSSMLRDGRDWGVVAATQLILSAPYMESLKTLLPKDYTKSFSMEASGFVRSEAVGVLILKRLDSEDHPLLVLESAHAVHSGAVVTPVVASVAKLVDECGPVDYIEGHGTATAVGDGVEAMAYQTAGWGEVVVASSKAQFGHSEAASGLLQLVKVAQIMDRSRVPAILHNLLPNEHIRGNTCLRLPFVNEEREVSTTTVVSFGITGTKTAILAKKPEVLAECTVDLEHILVLSAKSKASLKQSIETVIEMLKNTSYSLADLAKALQTRKSNHKWRVSIVATDHIDALRKLPKALDSPSTVPPVLQIPLDAYSIFYETFCKASGEFKQHYEAFCDRLRFEPHSDVSNKRHCLAVAFAMLKLINASGLLPDRFIASGPGSLLLMAHFELTAAHYINDLFLAFLSEDIRQMKRITRDLNISTTSIQLLNIHGEPMTTARQFVDACFVERTEDYVELAPGTIFVGDGNMGSSGYQLNTYSSFLHVLSSRYMSGSEVNWSQFGSPPPSNIPLPEYPFDRRSHWIPMTVSPPSKEPKNIVVDLETLEWIHVKDHVINGEIIVPGATSLRIISSLESGKCIESVDFLTPIRPGNNGKIEFSQNITSDGARTLVADGVDSVSFSVKSGEKIAPSATKTEQPRKFLEKQAIYDRLSLSALMYQKKFQVLSTLHTSLGKGTATFSPVEHLDLLLDGALQAVAMGYLLEQPGDHHPWLPFNIERVVILDKKPKNTGLVVYFTYKQNGDFLRGDLSVFDVDGKLVLDVKNVCFKRKEIEGRAAVPKATVSRAQPVVKTSEVLREKAKSHLLRWFEESFGWNDLDERSGFFDLGLSSLQAVRLRNFLREQYPSASATSVFDHPTIYDLSNYLASLDSENENSEDSTEAVESKDTSLVPVAPSRLSEAPVGIRSAACRLPSGITDPAEFWQLLLTGKNASSRTPASRIGTRDVLIKGQKYGASVEGGNFIDQDVSAFDPGFFKISKSEAEMMDPQQRLLLECVEECIENSGNMDMSEVGVFVGLMEKEYTDLMEQSQTSILSMLGSMVAVIAGRVNYVFGSYGPSVTVDTACSSSLVAVEMAVNALLDGRCKRAIVAGVNLILSEKGQGLRSNGKMLSAHGMSLSFDARASGYGRSDGCVVLMLEKVKPATGYLATLGGVNVNHGGRSVSLTAPNGVAHKILLSSLFQTTESSKNVAVWEAHGTGTSLGDPIEVNTLSSLLSDVIVSSAKASLGHGEASAGTCGLLKLAMTLKNDYVPQLIHFHVLNKDIQPGTLRIPVIGEESEFRMGGISSFGVSGTNAAVIAKKDENSTTVLGSLNNLYLIPLSAKNNNSLNAFQTAVEDLVLTSDEPIGDICGVLGSRNHHNKRKVLIVNGGGVVRNIINEGVKRKPEFSLGAGRVDFDLLAIDGISENYELLAQFGMDREEILMVALGKFLQGALPSFKWQSTSEKSQILGELASGTMESSSANLRKFMEAASSSNFSTSEASIALGSDVSDLASLLQILGELFVSNCEVDWSSVYSPPSRFLRLPTYPFNRQSIWFNERKPVFEDKLLGTEVTSTEDGIEFQNQLSELRHPSIFRHGFGLGSAFSAVTTAGTRFLGSSFKISEISLEEVKLKANCWLTTEIRNKKITGKINGKTIFSSKIEPFSMKSKEQLQSVNFDKKEYVYIPSSPSSVVISNGGEATRVESCLEDPYRVLFSLVSSVQGMDCILPLEKKFTMVSSGEETKVFNNGKELAMVICHGEHMKKEMVGEPINEDFKEMTRKMGQVQPNTDTDVTAKIRMALSDVMPEEISEKEDEGFMELGMDSLTLVDFVNRLNEKYFTGLEITTTDVFDHPNVSELSTAIKKKISEANTSQEEIIQEEKKSPKQETQNGANETAGEIREKVRAALVDVLPEEPSGEEQGFMEMGMDSLTLVDFVNRLNDKYFPGMEISTTDVFDNPTVGELGDHLLKKIGGGDSEATVQFVEAKTEETGSTPENVEQGIANAADQGALAQGKKMITQALLDVLTEEPTDLSQGFMEMGMDSLTLVDFVNRLGEKYFPQAEITTTDVFDNPSIDELANFVVKKTSPVEEQHSGAVQDSGIGSSSGEASPKEAIPTVAYEDAYFFVEKDEKNTSWDYQLTSKNGKIVLLTPQRQATSLDSVKTNSTVSINFDKSDLSPEALFLGLIEFVKKIVAKKLQVTITVPQMRTSSQWMAKAFFKTAAAEKPNNLKLKWTEKLQKKRITEEDLIADVKGFWLITGGLSGIGLSAARWLVNDCGVDGVVLVSRRKPQGELKEELEKMGKKAVVKVISADITDGKTMKKEIKALGFKIDGVIHCAGVIQDAMLARQSSVTFNKVFNPKALGYDVLDSVLTSLGHTPSSFICMSSFTSACGNVGQLNYGVANAYLDFKMEERLRQGRFGVSIHWGNWLETGMAANENIHKILSDHGFLGFSTDEALKYLKYAILRKPNRFMAAKIDWSLLLPKRKDIPEDLVKPGYIEDLPEVSLTSSSQVEAVIKEVKPVTESPGDEESEEEEEKVEKITDALVKLSEKLLKQKKIKTNKSFMEMGFTSHTLATLLEDIKLKYGLKLTIAVFYEHPNIEELAEHLANLVEDDHTGTDAKEKNRSYCDVLAMSIYCNEPKELPEAINTAINWLNGKDSSSPTPTSGKYLAQVKGSSISDLIDKLKIQKTGDEVSQTPGKLVIMFPGQGAQYPLMGAQLAESFPLFKDIFHSTLAKADALLNRQNSLLNVLNSPELHKDLLLTSNMQPVMFSFCYALGKLWEAFGLVPDFYLGHSVGELVAGVLAGIMDIDEGIKLIVTRGLAMENIANLGAMLAVDSRAVDDVLGKYPLVSIAAINSPKQAVLAGPKKDLDSALIFVKGKQLQATFVNAKYPFHSAMIKEEHLKDLRKVLKTINFKRSQKPIISNVTGEIIHTFTEEYLVKHTVSAVRFVDCANTLVNNGVSTWLEAGTAGTLTSFLKRIVDPKQHRILQSIQEKNDECEKFIETALVLEKSGFALDWEMIYTNNAKEDRLVNHPITEPVTLGSLETSVIKQHCLNGEPIVPGTLQLFSLLNTVNKDSTENNFFTLLNAKLPTPWKIKDSLEGLISRNWENRVNLKVNGKTSCQADIKLNNGGFKSSFDVSSVEKECNIEVDVGPFYEDFKKWGLFYGPKFRLLNKLRRSDSRTIATEVVQDGDFLWTLMDSALHSVCLTVHHRRPEEYFVPVSFSEVYVTPNMEIKAGQKLTFMSHLATENEKFMQVNCCLLVDGKLAFEAKNAFCVVVKSLQNVDDGKITEETKKDQRNGDTMEKQASSASSNISDAHRGNVVVVGYDASFCFASLDPPALWQQLSLGLTSHRYEHRQERPSNVNLIDRDITLWDPEFFGISPKEASFIDPQQRLLMMSVYRALESCSLFSLPSNSAVFVGENSLEFMHRVYYERPGKMTGYLGSGTHGSSLAGRISHWLKIYGPSVVVDSACSSSSVALTMGLDAISSGKSDLAVVAGVNLVLHDTYTEVLQNAGMLSTESFCKVFDASANGYRRSEGIGVIILSSEAFASSHRLAILAEVVSWAIGHNGSSAALQVPNGMSQERIMREAKVAKGCQQPEVECHGTGTPLGDPIEAEAILRISGSTISSVKSHLGHTESASGMAAIIACLLQMKYNYRLPQLHFSCPNKDIKFGKLSLRLVGEEVKIDAIRVNNFGFSGTNVSTVLQSKKIESTAISPTPNIRVFYLLPLSAKSRESLEVMVREFKVFLKHCTSNLSEIGDVLKRRPQYRFRSIALLNWKRQVVLDFGEEPKTRSRYDEGSGNQPVLEFGYGSGVVQGINPVLSHLKLVELPSSLEFHLRIASLFVSRQDTINWELIDDVGPPSNVQLPGYSFNLRRFWPFGPWKSKYSDDIDPEIRTRNLFYKKELVPAKIAEKSGIFRNIVTISDVTNFQRIRLDQIPSLSRTIILFHPKSGSYHEAVELCHLWETVTLNQEVLIAVGCRDNGTSFTEWTALVRSLAAEKALPYLFISYQKEHELIDELRPVKRFNDVIFYKNGTRFVERLVQISPSKQIRPNCHHLVISGGKGGIGSKIIEKLKPTRTTNFSRNYGFDVSKPDVDFPQTAADLMVHAAGIVDNGLLSTMTEGRFKKTGDVKVTGLQNLLKISDSADVLAISSAAAVFGSLGQPNYAFGNGKMVCEAQRSGRKVKIIHFGPWDNVGMLAKPGLEGIRRQIEEGGWRFLEPGRALEAIDIEGEELIVFDGDFDKILKKNPHLNNFLENVHTVFDDSSQNERPKSEILSVREILEEVSGIADFELERETPLMSLGLDSLMMEEARNRIQETFGIRLSSADLYDNCTLERLEKVVSEDCKKRNLKFDENGNSESAEDHRKRIGQLERSRKGYRQEEKSDLHSTDKYETTDIEKNDETFSGENIDFVPVSDQTLNQRHLKHPHDGSETLVSSFRDERNSTGFVMRSKRKTRLKSCSDQKDETSDMNEKETSDHFRRQLIESKCETDDNYRASTLVLTQHPDCTKVKHPPLPSSREYFKAENQKKKPHISPKVAIIGASGSFSGAEDIQEFWKNLLEGKESINRCDSSPGFISAAGIASSTQHFDYKFFKMTKEEADALDPQVRRFVTHAYLALENSGYVSRRKSLKIGVYAGAEPSNYCDGSEEPQGSLQKMFRMNMKDHISTITAHCLDLKGPAIGVYSACSTSILAMNEGIQALQLGCIDLAVVGGSSLVLPGDEEYEFEEGMVLSKSGTCRPFDKAADGTVRGSSVGCFVLKRLEAAELDGDHIFAVIEGIGVSNDGSGKASFMAPTSSGQAEAIRNALKELGPDYQIGYVECHGTGTTVGDEIELKALRNAYGNSQNFFIGSVKANIGHGFAGAGVASLAKAVKILETGLIPQQINFKKGLDGLNDNFRIPLKVEKMPEKASVGVSAFGIGGTNGHVVLGKYRKHMDVSKSSGEKHRVRPVLLPLSATSDPALSSLKQKISSYLQAHPERFEDVATTLQNRREMFKHRTAVLAKDAKEAVEFLETSKSFLQIPGFSEENIAFFFAPQGVQFPHMGSDFIKEDTAFRKTILNLCEIASDVTQIDFYEVLYPTNPEDERIMRPDLAQIAIFIINMATAAQLAEFGIRAGTLLGHSVGEYAAMTLGGVFSPRETIELLYHRGKLCYRTPKASMLAITGELPELPKGVEVSAILSQTLRCVVGPPETILKFKETLTELGKDFRELRTERGFHSYMLDGVTEEFRNTVCIKAAKPHKKIISSMDGRVLTNVDPYYLVNHMRNPVNVDLALKKLFSDPKIKMVVEVGPSGVLRSLVRENRPDVICVQTITKKTSFRQQLADFWSLGFPIPEFGRLSGRFDPNLPGYQFEDIVCWKEPLPQGSHHRLFEISWVPLAPQRLSIFSKKILVVAENQNLEEIEAKWINPKEIQTIGASKFDFVVYFPRGQEASEIYFTTKRLLEQLDTWNTTRFTVFSNGNPLDWVALGPIREHHLVRKGSSTACSFVENSDCLPLRDLLSKVYGSSEDSLLVTKTRVMKLAYSEFSKEDSSSISGITGTAVVIGATGPVGKAYCRILESIPEVKKVVKLGRSIKNDVMCDVTSEQSISEALDSVRDQFGSIDVIVNLAGKATSSSLAKTAESVKEVFAPKIRGTMNVLRYLEKRQLRLKTLILSSSLSSYLGIYGSDDYAAANSFLDGLAVSGHPLVDKICSIQWPLWKEGGMGRDLSGEVGKLLERGGISSAKGMKAIKESLGLQGVLAYSLMPPGVLRNTLDRIQLQNDFSPKSSPSSNTRLDVVMNSWKTALSLSQVTGDTNFFEAGGNSLNALRLIWSINSGLDLKLNVNYVFSNPLFKQFHQNLPTSEHSKDSGPKFNPTKTIPLSFAQENMYLLRMLEPGPQYNIVFSIAFPSGLDRLKMSRAVLSLIARQRSLRTIFPSQESQEILSLTESYHYLEELSENGVFNEEKNFLFAFESTPPIRIRWISGEKGFSLVFNQHHILTDGWSMSVLANELEMIYKSFEDPKAIKETVAEFAIQSKNHDFEEHLQELKEKLQNVRDTSLKPDVIMTSDADASKFQKVEKFVPHRLVQKIKKMANAFNTTEFVISLSAFLLTIRSWKQEVDEDAVTIGVPVSGRNSLSENLIGYFLNNVVLSVKFDNCKNLEETIGLVDSEFKEARKYESVPFHKLVAELGIDRQIGKHPLFQLYFNYRHALDYPKVSIEGEECEISQVSMNTLFDVSTTIDETPKGLRILTEYNGKKYSKNLIKRLLNDFLRCLSCGRIRETVLLGPKIDVPDSGVPKVKHKESHNFSYSITQEVLKLFGIATRADNFVVLELDPNQTATLIPQILQIGCGYAPLDPTWPTERKSLIMRNLGNPFVLDRSNLNILRTGRPRKIWNLTGKKDLAYVIHTSGSTGIPKGVTVTHLNVMTFITGATRQMLISSRSTVYNSVNTVFDVSVGNILGSYVNSAKLKPSRDLRNQLKEAESSNFVFLTSAVFNSISNQQLESLQNVEKLFVGGESVQDRNLKAALELGIEVTQIYGPTEGTVWSLTNRCKLGRPEGRVVGTPMSNESISFRGELGELTLKGDKVARGYLNSKGFKSIYRTKDLVQLDDKKISYLGRLDGEVKIRGNRVELREIEKELLKIGGISQAVVLPALENTVLVAFLVAKASNFDQDRLKTLLSSRLPSFCIPSFFISLPEIPLNSSGKTDKSKLLQEFHQKMRRVPNVDSGEHKDIANSFEERVMAVFGSMLKVTVEDPTANFFSLGGHSLLLLTLQSELKKEFGVEVPVPELFSNPTVAAIARILAEQMKSSLKDTDTSIITKLREAENPKFNVYLTHAIGGTIFPYYAFLQIFPKNVSVYAIEFQLEYNAETLKELAALYAKAIAAHTKTIRPFLVGHSMGGSISREMIPDLKMWGWEIPFVIMFDSWVLRPQQLDVEKIRSFMEVVFAPLPNAAVRVERAVKLGKMLKNHRVTRSPTKTFLFKSCELGSAAFREAVRPDLTEELSRSLTANGFDRVSHQPVTTWMINGDHESCLKVENLKSRQKEILSIFNEYL